MKFRNREKEENCIVIVCRAATKMRLVSVCVEPNLYTLVDMAMQGRMILSNYVND